MKKTEINFKYMVDTVCSLFEKEQSIWMGKIPIETVYSGLISLSSEIDGYYHEQEGAITEGVTNKMKSYYKNMVALSMRIINKLRPYAKLNKIDVLLANIDFSKSDLDQVKQEEGIAKCKIVLENGLKYIAEMSNYEPLQEELDALRSSINGLAMLTGKRDLIIGTHKSATQIISELIEKARFQLEIMDDLVPGLIDDPKFIRNYQNNRRIIDRNEKIHKDEENEENETLEAEVINK